MFAVNMLCRDGDRVEPGEAPTRTPDDGGTGRALPLFFAVSILFLCGMAAGQPLDEALVRDVRVQAPEAPQPDQGIDFSPIGSPAPGTVKNPVGDGLLVFYGCATCHGLPVRSTLAAGRGPDLDRVGEKTTSRWLQRWLQDPAAVDPDTRMPKVPLTEVERSALVAFLLALRQPDVPVAGRGSAGAGRALFEAAQCRSCHRLGGRGGEIGPALDGIREKIRRPWLAAFLRKPGSVVSNSRMPDYGFSGAQARDLAEFLLGDRRLPAPEAPPDTLIRSGLSVFARKGCAGCHRVGAWFRPLGVPAADSAASFVAYHTAEGASGPQIPLADVQAEAMAGALISGQSGGETVGAGPFLQAYWETPVRLQGQAPAAYDSSAARLDPQACGTCHTEQLADWRLSVHSRGMGPGVMGQLVDAVGENPGFIAACQACHAPLAEQHPVLPVESGGYGVNERFDPELRGAGIACAVCHVRAPPRFGPPPAARPAARLWAGPGHGGAVEAPVFEDSEFCAKCHQFAPGGFALNGKLLQNTHAEWDQSPQARAGQTCQSCHMPDRRHLWRGIHDPEMVRQAVDLSARPVGGTDSLVVEIRLANVGAGHHLPTYVTPRLFVRARLLDARGGTLPETQAERVVGREVVLGPDSYEVFDTRIPAGGAWVWRYAVARPKMARELDVSVEVHPDHFYLGFFESYSRAGAGVEARELLDSAEENARNSPYVLVERRWDLTDLRAR